MKQRLFAAVAAVLFASGSALAADLPAKAPYYKAPIGYYNWGGCYIGGHGGGGWANFENGVIRNQNFAQNYGDFATGQGFDHDGSGGVAGGHVGCNYQSGQFVFGIEGAYAGANIKGDFLDRTVGAGDDQFTQKVTGIGSVVGRLGIANNNWLFYAKGGWATARSRFSVVDVVTPITGSGSVTNWHNGWTVGGGVEVGFFGNWIAGVEANFYRFESKTYELGNPAGALAYTWDAGPRDVTTVLGRLSYKY